MGPPSFSSAACAQLRKPYPGPITLGDGRDTTSAAGMGPCSFFPCICLRVLFPDHWQGVPVLLAWGREASAWQGSSRLTAALPVLAGAFGAAVGFRPGVHKAASLEVDLN